MFTILNKNNKIKNKNQMRDFLLKNTIDHIKKITKEYKNKNKNKNKILDDKIFDDKIIDINELKNKIAILNKTNTFLLFLSISSILFILHKKN